VEVVEQNDAVLFEPVTNAEPQLRRKTTDRCCQMRHDDRIDSVGDGVSGKHEDRHRTCLDHGKVMGPFNDLHRQLRRQCLHVR
jgi:hypothetical protein